MKYRIPVVLLVLVCAVARWGTAQTQPLELRITWTAPTTNADGSPLTDLAGYTLCLNVGVPIPADLDGTDTGALAAACTAVIRITDPAAIAREHTLSVPVKTENTLYARIAAFDDRDNMSVFSNQTSVDFDFLPPEGGQITILLISR